MLGYSKAVSMFQEADEDHDGKLSYVEFVKFAEGELYSKFSKLNKMFSGDQSFVTGTRTSGMIHYFIFHCVIKKFS